MTRKEAIKELKEDIELYIPLHGTIDDVDRDLPDGRLITALEMGIKALEQEPRWIPVSERFPEENGDYLVTYEKGYAEDYDLGNIGIAGFEVDCESFGYWYEHFDRYTLGSLGSEWEKIEVIAWMPLPTPFEPQESEDRE